MTYKRSIEKYNEKETCYPLCNSSVFAATELYLLNCGWRIFGGTTLVKISAALTMQQSSSTALIALSSLSV